MLYCYGSGALAAAIPISSLAREIKRLRPLSSPLFTELSGRSPCTTRAPGPTLPYRPAAPNRLSTLPEASGSKQIF